MKTEVSIKQEHIIEAAIKRFAHFGINKTTITEIADDLGITRPSLFYYFPDKNALVKAVLNKIVTEFLEALQGLFNSAQSVEAGLYGMIDFKRSFFKKYHLMALHDDRKFIASISPEIADLRHAARTATLNLLNNFIAKGIERNELKSINPETTGRLLIETFTAFEHCSADKMKVPNDTEFDSLFDKEKEVLSMILTGLKTPSWTN